MYTPQVLLIRSSKLVEVGAIDLPSLLHVDLSKNKIKNLNQVIKFTSRCRDLVYLNLLDNPVCNTRTWRQRADPLPLPKSKAWRIVAGCCHLGILNDTPLTGEHHEAAANKHVSAQDAGFPGLCSALRCFSLFCAMSRVVRVTTRRRDLLGCAQGSSQDRYNLAVANYGNYLSELDPICHMTTWMPEVVLTVKLPGAGLKVAFDPPPPPPCICSVCTVLPCHDTYLSPRCCMLEPW